MTTAYTAEQLAHFMRLKDEAAPPPPASDDLKAAAHVVAVSAGGAPEGMLLVLLTDKGMLKLFLNPVLAVQLSGQVKLSGQLGTWWDEDYKLLPVAAAS